MLKFLHLSILHTLPKILLTKFVGFLANIQLPSFILRFWIWIFSKKYHIQQNEIAEQEFHCFNEFFARKLKPECRPIDSEPLHIVSPVDGRIGAMGNMEQATLFQAKGIIYSLADLLAYPAWTPLFDQGSYMTIYLSPSNYHRIHTPIAGTIEEALYVPGGLYPVYPFAVQNIPGLFARNERIITLISHPTVGKVAMIKVGATIVGKTKVTYDTIEAQHTKNPIHRDYHDRNITFAKGQELGRFEMGSTVIVLFPSQKIQFFPFEIGQALQYGQAIGKIIA